MRSHAAVGGVGFTVARSPRRQTQSKPELCFEASDRALGHAGITRDQVDAVVFGDIAGFEATNVATKTLAPAIGLPRNIPIYPISTGGTSGGHLVNQAASLVRSGSADRVLCVGAPTFDGPVDLQAVINTNSPMVMEQPLGMGAVHMGAFFPSAYQERYGATDADFLAVAEKNRGHAAHNPYAHVKGAMEPELADREISTPLRLGMVCPVSSGACAIVVEREDLAAGGPNPPVRISGYGSISDGYLGGTRRDFSSFEVLSVLAERVYREAQIAEPGVDLDVFELFCPYSPMELMLLEAIGVCDYGEAPALLRDGDTRFGGRWPTNVSGGIQCTNPGVGGQIAPCGYVALQLMGQAAGDRQVEPARRGIAHSTGGTFFQFHTLTVMERVAD
jgi:acetyl-CoA C-acetyltransferase